MVEHSTADREVPGSNPGAPYLYLFLSTKTNEFIINFVHFI